MRTQALKQPDTYTIRRSRMIIKLQQLGIHNPAVLDAMMQVPRHLFVEEALAYNAYENCSLPISLGQTISQPYIVARMTELLCGPEAQVPHKVLEIGTGCGYQTAVLMALGVEQVYSVERLSQLHQQAKKNLRHVKGHSARLVCGDGYLGLPEAAPFDAVIVTAAPKEIPEALLLQLAPGGKIVLPLAQNGKQHLWLIEKHLNGFQETCVEPVHFVPLLTGKS